MTEKSQFDDVASDYPAYPNELPLRDHMELPSLRAAVGDVTDAVAMDLGCGPGRYARYLASWGARRVVGVDAAAGMIELARANETAEPLGIQYRQADVATDHLPDLADTFDVVLSCYALPYAHTHEALTGMFTTASTVLRPGGRLVAATLNPDYADENVHPGHYHPYNMRLTAHTHPPEDGTPLNFVASFGNETTPPMTVTAYWWSTEAYERAARAAGFTTVTWRHLTVSDTGIERYGRDLWTNYLARPHAVVIEASLPHGRT